MDFSGLLRRLLTDSHIYFALKVLLAIAGLLAFALATGDIQLTVLLSSGWWPAPSPRPTTASGAGSRTSP
jgi:hypothetical protein